MKRARRRAGGYAIGIALVVLVLVGAAATAIAVSLQLESRTSMQEARRIHLVALGDAALAEALAELARSRSFQGAPEHRLGNGTIGSTVRAVGANRFEIVTTARLRGWQQVVVAEVATGGSIPAVVSWKLAP